MEFTPGINIIVGRNNAGKTSLLELLTLDFNNHPHKSIKTLPNKLSKIKEISRIEFIWHLKQEELQNLIKQLPPPFGIPLPKLSDNYIEFMLVEHEGDPEQYKISYTRYVHESVKNAFEEFKSFSENSNFIELNLLLNPDRAFDDKSLKKLLNFESYEEDFNNCFYKIKFNDKNIKLQEISYLDEFYQEEKELSDYKGKIEDSIGYKIFDIFLSRIYKFDAERLKIGICKSENKTELKSNASNLAEVLFILQGKIPGMFAQFNELVSIILTEIKWISIVPRENSNVEIMIWNIDIKLNRDDLSLPLSSCGSGVGQVLAILYILVSSEEPRTLIIDEPQSFLHPGAARKLIEIIKKFPQHQYFIATHSPEIITAANPSNIIKLQYQDCETKASVINSKEIESQNAILDDLGVRLSDVFGADNILWVEGQTEEICFPLIIESLLKIPLMGTKILSVHSTDALLDGKRSDLVFDIYQKLTTGASLFPTAMGFIFDRESKTERKIQELEKKGVTFLRLPMYENYLLVPEAISAIINQEATWLEEPITNNQVQQYLHLDRITKEKEYLLQGVKKEDVLDDNWLLKVHGANILESMFQELCDSKLEFRKTKHSPMITEWLIKNQPDFLSELSEELKMCLNKTK
ncbi:AAA family ATPase [Nodularia sphaerocarpa]|nr:AAA family ATPase [Nodularia sphaerocarpa]